MNNTLIQNINLNMDKDKKELFKEIIIKYLIEQITTNN
jgi:hypothetical protein